MKERVFPVLPERRRAMALNAVAYLVASGLGLWLAVATAHWLWWVFAGVVLGLFVVTAVMFVRRRTVAKVDSDGVTVWLPTGRTMVARWSEIEAHTIDPERRLGAVLMRSGAAGRVRVLPVSTRLMGPDAARALIAAMQERLPTLEYRVPSIGRK